MKLGFFIQPVHPIDRNYRELLDEDREAIILADRRGYDEALLGEHYTDLAEPISSSLMFSLTCAWLGRTVLGPVRLRRRRSRAWWMPVTARAIS